MHPVVGERLAGERFALRNFVFMMGKDVIDAARVDVEMQAKILHRHGAALDVPAGEASPPGAIPRHFAPRLSHLPQREVLRTSSILNHAFAHARQHILKLVAGELTIAGEAFDIKIDIAIDFVSYALRLQTLNDS